MSPKPRLLRAAATAVLALATALGTALPAVAAPSASRPHTTFGPSGGSQTWAGYVSPESVGYYNSVSATYRVPSATTCTYSSSPDSPDYGVALGGYYTSSSPAFIGVGDDCGSTGIIVIIIRCIPFCPPPGTGLTSYPGDTIDTTLTYLSGDEYRGTVQNVTRGWTYSLEFAQPGADRSSAGAIVADTLSGSPVLLNNFGTVAFQSATVNGSPLNSLSPTALTMLSTTGTPMVTPSSISSGGAFTATFANPGP